MTIAWRRLADVPADDPLPWRYATARNLVLAEARRAGPSTTAARASEPVGPRPELHELDPELGDALRSLPRLDREALLIVAWEDLTPTQAAKALGINPSAFRVRLLRARRRFRARLEERASDDLRPAPVAHLEVEGT